MKYLIFAFTCLMLGLAFIFAKTFYKETKTEKISSIAKTNYSVFVREHSQSKGSDNAKVQLVEFMDPACETCAAFSPFVEQMMAANPGKIKLVLRYAPFHDGADYFVKILEAAKKQGKYWQTLKIMYQSQSAWASHHNPQPQKIWQFLPYAELNLEQLKKDMSDPALDKIIAQDLADAKTLNVHKTPGFFVNGKPLQEFGYKQLQNLIYSEIAANYPK